MGSTEAAAAAAAAAAVAAPDPLLHLRCDDPGPVADDAPVPVPVPWRPLAPVPVCDSASDVSGVVGRDVCALKVGRSREVSEGEGGSGVGGRL